ncbi:MAG: hypothetical protein RSG59_07210 [Ruthenibacterium sp.]
MEQNRIPNAAQPQRTAPQRPAAPQPAQGQSAPAQRPMQQPAQGQAAQRPMQQRPAAQQPQQGVEKQLIVRMFQPDMQLLKVTAKQISATASIKLGLYGQSGEVLVVIAARARTAMAATELTENAAGQFEAAMGDSVYGRGKAPIGAVVVAEMEQDETTLVAADDATGLLLETELQPIKNADKVFDFGQNSFRNARMADKIADAALMDDEESDDPIQLSADRSFAARKCTKSDFGVCIVDVEGGKMVCSAVTYGKMVYVRCIRPAPDAGKAAAMTALDMIRRLTLGMPIPYARAFKAGQEIDWNEPMQQKGRKSSSGKSGGSKSSSGKSGTGKKKSLAVPIVLLVLVAIALCGAIWYVVNTFIIKDEGSLPAAGSTGSSAVSMPAGDTSVPGDAAAPGSDTGAPASDAAAPDAPAVVSSPAAPAAGAGTGEPVVHPFS